MRIRPGYLVSLNGHEADDMYPDGVTEGDVGLVVDFDIEDIGVEDHPFFTVWVADGAKGSYEDGFWASELSIVCDGKRHARRTDQHHRSD